MSEFDEDPIDAMKRHRDWLIATCMNGVRYMRERGEHEEALACVEATIQEDSKTERAGLGALREEIREFLEKQRATQVA